MLDLTKIARQMQGISEHLSKEAEQSRQRLEVAQKLRKKAQGEQEQLIQEREIWRDRMGFTPAIPAEPLDFTPYIPTPPNVQTVIATDGSQIAPSHHEIAYCYLINVGRVILHYGQSRLPLLDSLPEVFYKPEDLYISRQWGIKTEEWMGYRRGVSEAIALADLAIALRTPGSGQIAHPEAPILGMVDGALIYWFLEPLPTDARQLILGAILEAWEKMRQVKVPIVGYISASRSSESLSFLRLAACPNPHPDCFTHCPIEADSVLRPYDQKAPCQVFDPLRDTTLWASVLEPGQRSPLWRSCSRILDLYPPEHQVYFCYLHVGPEIARIDMPAWVAQDPSLLSMALSMVLSQVQKGYGYPVVLAEAHNQAVVRGGDRARFFALLEQQMIKAGLQNVGTSYKETRKRGSIA
ncbi:MAG TPA: DNA double-strand break repair nuclease NurA [Vampirovibrionales bacterium]